MDPGILIGALALFTIGAVLTLSIGHFGFFLRDPQNRFQVSRILAGGEAASTAAARDDPAVSSEPLSARLDKSIASSHPANPEHSETQTDRTARFHAEKHA